MVVHADEVEEVASLKKKTHKKKKKKTATAGESAKNIASRKPENEDLSMAILGGSSSRNSMQVKLVYYRCNFMIRPRETQYQLGFYL